MAKETTLNVKKAKCPVALECNKDGVPYRSLDNVIEILRHDQAIAGKFGVDEFSDN